MVVIFMEYGTFNAFLQIIIVTVYDIYTYVCCIHHKNERYKNKVWLALYGITIYINSIMHPYQPQHI